MNITEETYGSTLILTCKGELTEDTLDAFKQVVERHFPDLGHPGQSEPPAQHDNAPSGNPQVSPSQNQGTDSSANKIGSTVRGLVLDIKAVPFIDSVGLEYLLDLRDRISAESGTLKLVNIDENVSKILEITQLDIAFERFDDLSQAIKTA